MLVFVNDSRPEYAQNLLDATALPVGATHTFRFARKWIEPELHEGWERNSLAGSSLWIVFHTTESADAEFIPVRSAAVIRTEFSGQLGILEVSVGSFAGEQTIETLAPGGGRAAVPYRSRHAIVDSVVTVLPDDADDVSAWQATAGRLTGVPAFRNGSLIYVRGVREIGHDWYRLGPSGYRVGGGRSIELVINSLSPSSAGPRGAYLVSTETGVVRISPTQRFELGYKFDLFAPRLVIIDESRPDAAVIDIQPTEDARGPRVRLILDIAPSRMRQFVTYVLPGASAVIAATAGVLPSDAPMWARLAMVAIGSAGLAVSAGLRR